MRGRPPFFSWDFQILLDTLGLQTLKIPKLAHMNLCVLMKFHMGLVFNT